MSLNADTYILTANTYLIKAFWCDLGVTPTCDMSLMSR